jgi:hypothetical protein
MPAGPAATVALADGRRFPFMASGRLVLAPDRPVPAAVSCTRSRHQAFLMCDHA